MHRRFFYALLLSYALIALPASAFASAPPPAPSSAPATLPAAPFPAASGQFPQLPLKRDPVDDSRSTWIITAMLMLALGAAALVTVKKRQGRLAATPGGMLKATRSAALTSTASLHVVDWQGEQLLLGCTAHTVTVLSRHTIQLPEQAGPSA